jgi:hypothetical protein
MAANQSNQREKQIFERALDLGSSKERLGYVKGACADDTALHARVQALLQVGLQARAHTAETPSLK